MVLEIRLKPSSYKQHKHTFNSYEHRKNEPNLVENRSLKSKDVAVFALWHLQKDFIRKQTDYNIIMKKLSKYMNQ